ncbi:metalloreductase STEAP3-like [Pollicipes pollicipes]|uniref:metalloreductase STEAP3-like n=1 Tax=Pollicipes pollicipes TaxID=41117 RepID=UPI0018859331|nr:metalloreductase STEAP3-like [Pollicipes pollicipes]
MAPKSQLVKAFNVLSAYALENNLQGGKKVFVAGNYPEANAVVAQLISDMGFTPADMGGLAAARKIEKIPLQLFPSWKTSVIVTLVIFIFFWIYSLFKYQICTNIESNAPWDVDVFTNVLMVNFNRALAMTGITLLAATYLPGVLAAYLQLKRGTKYSQFPQWLNKWLLTRKELGLAALMLAVLHGIISITMSSPFYLATAYDQPAILLARVKTAGNSSEVHHVEVFNRLRQGRAEFGLTVGAGSLCVLAGIGVTSLPSVGAALSWREFQFMQSTLGWGALLSAVLHNTLLGWDFMVLNYTCSLPSALQIGMYLPTITVLLKLPLLIPLVSEHLAAIRGGLERKERSEVVQRP